MEVDGYLRMGAVGVEFYSRATRVWTRFELLDSVGLGPSKAGIIGCHSNSTEAADFVCVSRLRAVCVCVVWGGGGSFGVFDCPRPGIYTSSSIP